MSKYDGIDFTPPAGVRAAFKRGLKLHADGKSGDGLVSATVAWATRIADGEAITPEKARKGRAWHARHAVDKRPGWGTPGGETPGYVAFMLWGGAPGRAWFSKLVRQMDAADAQESSMKTLSLRRSPITEAVVVIPDGQSIMDWLHELEEAAIKAVAARLPPAQVDERGRYPDQWLRMVDPKPDEVLIRVYRWGQGDDSFEAHFLVKYTSDANGVVTIGAVTEVEAEYKLVITELPPGDSEMPAAAPPAPETDAETGDESSQIAEALEALRTKKPDAAKRAAVLLEKVSGRHPDAAKLAIELSRSRN